MNFTIESWFTRPVFLYRRTPVINNVKEKRSVATLKTKTTPICFSLLYTRPFPAGLPTTVWGVGRINFMLNHFDVVQSRELLVLVRAGPEEKCARMHCQEKYLRVPSVQLSGTAGRIPPGKNTHRQGLRHSRTTSKYRSASVLRSDDTCVNPLYQTLMVFRASKICQKTSSLGPDNGNCACLQNRHMKKADELGGNEVCRIWIYVCVAQNGGTYTTEPIFTVSAKLQSLWTCNEIFLFYFTQIIIQQILCTQNMYHHGEGRPKLPEGFSTWTTCLEYAFQAIPWVEMKQTDNVPGKGSVWPWVENRWLPALPAVRSGTTSSKHMPRMSQGGLGAHISSGTTVGGASLTSQHSFIATNVVITRWHSRGGIIKSNRLYFFLLLGKNPAIPHKYDAEAGEEQTDEQHFLIVMVRKPLCWQRSSGHVIT